MSSRCNCYWCRRWRDEDAKHAAYLESLKYAPSDLDLYDAVAIREAKAERADSEREAHETGRAFDFDAVKQGGM